MTTTEHKYTTTKHQIIKGFCGKVLLPSGDAATLDTDDHTDGTGETWLTFHGGTASHDSIECAIDYLKQVLSFCGVNRLRPAYLTGGLTRLSVYIPHTLSGASGSWVVLDKDGKEVGQYQSRHDAEFTASQILGWSVEEHAPCDDCGEPVAPTDFCGHGTQYLCPDCYGVKA